MMEVVTAREVLGVPVGASRRDIDKAYRLLALRHHPDVGGDPARFLRVTDAYETLQTARHRIGVTYLTTKWQRRRARFVLGLRRFRGLRRVQ